jgi:small subunit ribosomal protein S17
MADETPETEQTADATAAGESAAPAGPTLTAKEERARAAHAASSQRPSRTPEQRDAERRELRRGKALARTRRRQQEKAKRAQAATAPGATGTPPAEPKASSPQARIGTVVSAKPDKTIVVRIDVARRHRKYQKIVRSTNKLHVHDEANDANEGDRVRVVESRPLSRTKRWKLVEVLERAK